MIKPDSKKRVYVTREWANTIIDATIEAEKEIPLKTRCEKGTSTQPYGFRDDSQLARNIEIIRIHYPKRFQCASDFHRAAGSILSGIMLAEIERDKDKAKPRDNFLYGECYNILNETDDIISKMITIDDITKRIMDLYTAFKGEIITTAAEFNKLADELIERVPEDLRPALKTRKKEIMNKRKLTDINFTVSPGGDRKSGAGTV